MRKWSMILAFVGLMILARGSRAFEVKELSIDYNRYHSTAFMPEIPNWQPKEALALNWDLDLYRDYLFWNNKIHAITDPGQYRLVGWNFWLGVRPLPWLEVAYEHHSQHILDAPDPYRHFPVNDSLYVKIYLIKTK